MKPRLILSFLVLTLVFAGYQGAFSNPAEIAGAGNNNSWQDKAESWVWNRTAEGEAEFLVFLAEQADLSGAILLKTKTEKGAFVYARLFEVASRTQSAIIAALKQSGAQYRPFWIANMIWVRGDRRVVEAMTRRADVRRIYANPRIPFDAPLEEKLSEKDRLSPASVYGVEENLQKVNADAVWALGHTGEGAVIGGQDTGYAWDHPALKIKYRGWDGSNADHNYNWHDAIHADNPMTPVGNPCGFDSFVPCDDDGHGTHTMGIMVGDDGAGNQVGMAPGAKWIACRNMEQGWGSPATYSECYQWFLAPTDLAGNNPHPYLAPDVINNSWACPSSEGCTDPQVLLQVVNNVRAAGILTVHSAGNRGPTCSSVSNPAAIYDASFTVGNVTIGDVISPSSSRGPVIVDGSGRLKPDISAPGTSIRSSIPGGGYGFKSGTSMAGPHVAGLVALLLSAKPELSGQVGEIEEIIQHSAVKLVTDEDCGGTSGVVPNNVYGWGRIDALGTILKAFQDFGVYFPIVYLSH